MRLENLGPVVEIKSVNVKTQGDFASTLNRDNGLNTNQHF